MPCSDYYTNISLEQQLASVMDWCNVVWELQLSQVIYDALALMYDHHISEKSCWGDAFPSGRAAPQWTTRAHCRRMLHLNISFALQVNGLIYPADEAGRWGWTWWVLMSDRTKLACRWRKTWYMLVPGNLPNWIQVRKCPCCNYAQHHTILSPEKPMGRQQLFTHMADERLWDY